MTIISALQALRPRQPARVQPAGRWPSYQVAEWRAYRDRLLTNINRAYSDNPRFPRWAGLQCEKWGPLGDDQRWLLVKIDMATLHHTALPMLTKPDLLNWLSKDRVVGKRVVAIETARALLYAIQLKPIPQPASIAAPQVVTLPDRISLPDYARPSGVLPTALGVTDSGPLALDLAQPYHIIVGGLTQHGKTALVHTLLLGVCRFASPQQLRVAIVDPKGQFVHFDRLPHLFETIAGPAVPALATDERAALKLVSAVVDEVDRRKVAFQQSGALDIDHYNDKARKLRRAAMPHMLLIVDEGVELSLTAGKAWMPLLTRIASRAASFGIRLVFISTSTTSDVIDTTFRNLFAIRISVKCSERLQSTKILGDGLTTAADLPNVRGRFAANLPDRGVVVGQGYYISRDDLERQAQAITDKWPTRSDSAPATEAAAVSQRDRDVAHFCLCQPDDRAGLFISTAIRDNFHWRAEEVAEIRREWRKQNWLIPSGANGERLSQTIRDLVGWVDPPKSV